MSLPYQSIYNLPPPLVPPDEPDEPDTVLDEPETGSSNSMPLPPEATYSSEDDLFQSIQAWAKQNRYCFRVAWSKKVCNGLRKKICYQCNRGGQLPVVNRPLDEIRRPQDRVRITNTAKTGCPFSVLGIQVDQDH
jgi:hypothetical protein